MPGCACCGENGLEIKKARVDEDIGVGQVADRGHASNREPRCCPHKDRVGPAQRLSRGSCRLFGRDLIATRRHEYRRGPAFVAPEDDRLGDLIDMAGRLAGGIGGGPGLSRYFEDADIETGVLERGPDAFQAFAHAGRDGP